MFDSKSRTHENPSEYIGARVTSSEKDWLLAEMKRRRMTMSDLIRLAFGKLHASTQDDQIAKERRMFVMAQILKT